MSKKPIGKAKCKGNVMSIRPGVTGCCYFHNLQIENHENRPTLTNYHFLNMPVTMTSILTSSGGGQRGRKHFAFVTDTESMEIKIMPSLHGGIDE